MKSGIKREDEKQNMKKHTIIRMKCMELKKSLGVDEADA